MSDDYASVCDVAQPGRVAQTRPINFIRKACDTLGYEIFEAPTLLNIVIMAVTESDTPDPATGELLAPKVICGWDTSGRIVRKDTLGNRHTGENGVIHKYTFNDSGRLTAHRQITYKMDGTETVDVDDEYLYVPGRPNAEYTRRYLGGDGNMQERTHQQILWEAHGYYPRQR